MDKMTERKKMVLAMEYIARQVNCEDVFMGWLQCGVADGDIPYGSLKVSDVDDCYIEDESFSEIMTEFLLTMKCAWEDGGLYCGGVVSDEEK